MPLISAQIIIKVEINKMDIQPKKSSQIKPQGLIRSKFIKKFWWLFVVFLICLAAIIVFFDLGDDEGGLFKDEGALVKSEEFAKNGDIVKTFTPESRIAFLDNPPTIVGNYLYIGTSMVLTIGDSPTEILAAIPDNFFYKMDLDFNVVWQYPLQKKMVAGGATLDSQGNIYFVTIDHSPLTDELKGKEGIKGYMGILHLVSLTNDGKLRWQKQITAEDEIWIHGMTNVAIRTDDIIYVGASKFYAYDTDGNIKWQYPEGDGRIYGYRNSPIIDSAGNIYFISPEPTEIIYGTDVIRAYKFAPISDGIPLWSTFLDNNIMAPEGGNKDSGGGKERYITSTPAFTTNQESLYAAVGNTINKVDTESGKLLWSFKPADATGGFKASPAVDANDNLYLGTKSNMESRMYAIKADGSGIIWDNLIGADLYPSPLIGDDNRLYFGSEGTDNGHFHAADLETGELVWNTGYGKNPMPDIGIGGSAALLDGYIYVGVFDVRDVENSTEALHKIKVNAQNYLPAAAWPRFHGGNENTGRKN